MSSHARRQRRRLTTPQGQHFTGIWNVVAGSTGKTDQMMITSVGDVYELKYLYKKNEQDPGQWRLLQELEYMSDTKTLENLVGADGRPRPGEPERCITFWNCVTRNRGAKCAIFAMRIGANPPDDQARLPDFEKGENGSWGAEEEAPPP